MNNIKFFQVHHWPLLTCGWCLIGIIITLSISVFDGHVFAFLPYISDTAAIPPESCVFSQFLNVASLFLAITLYIRYRIVDFDINLGNIHLSKKWNTLSGWLAVCVCIGMSIVGNFQETSMFWFHMVGAFMVFILGTVYCIIQTRISFAKNLNEDKAISSYKINKRLLYLRVLIALILVLSVISCLIYGIFAVNSFKGKSVLWWTEKDGGFQERLISVVAEWSALSLLLLYISTFTEEFKSLKFEEIKFSRTITTTNGHPKMH